MLRIVNAGAHKPRGQLAVVWGGLGLGRSTHEGEKSADRGANCIKSQEIKHWPNQRPSIHLFIYWVALSNRVPHSQLFPWFFIHCRTAAAAAHSFTHPMMTWRAFFAAHPFRNRFPIAIQIGQIKAICELESGCVFHATCPTTTAYPIHSVQYPQVPTGSFRELLHECKSI